MNLLVLQTFKDYFTDLHFSDLSTLDEIYDEGIVFQDPIHLIEGREQLKTYFNKLNQNLVEGSFEFTEESVVGDKAYLTWEMHIQTKRPRSGISASGISVLTIQEKITHQRDYFDAGELFYENLPLIGGLIRMLKRKLAN
ncbi:MAG: nuclear transport factor 2 family protein [Bacteroidota bacterium]